MKIAFYDTKPYDRTWYGRLAEEFGHEILFFDTKMSETTAKLADGCQVICTFVNDIVNKAVIDQLVAQGGKLLLLRCAGYDSVDLKAASGRLTVMRVPSYSPAAVAEFAAALLLDVNRKLHRAYTRTREFNFSLNGLMGITLQGRTAGVIGTGKIGKSMIQILKGFGMHILAYDLFPDEESGLEYVPLETLMRKSDVITLHCPLSKETKHIINSKSIQMMHDGVILINTSRGGLVDTSALLEGLKVSKFAGVGLDVYEEEENYFYEDLSNEVIDNDQLIRLLAYPNVILTSHQAFFTYEAIAAIAETTMENLKAFVEGKELQNEIKYQET